VPTLTDPNGWFRLRFPDAWQELTEDGVTILQTGCGTLFVGGGRHAMGRQESFGGADFLARFLRSLGIEVEESQILASGGEGQRVYHYANPASERVWRYWSITDDETALLISYTCEQVDAARETDEVERLIGSVQLFHSAPVH
jgi:hypothetical protein